MTFMRGRLGLSRLGAADYAPELSRQDLNSSELLGAAKIFAKFKKFGSGPL